MRARSGFTVAGPFGALLLSVLAPARVLGGDAGSGSAQEARRANVVAVVRGAAGSRHIDAGELEDRIAAMPAFQRVTFGRSADAIRRRVLDEAFVQDAILSLHAEALRLETQPAVGYALDRARATATVRAIRGLASADVPVADVRAYYERNRARYDAPELYQLWRILCKTREEAQGVLDAAFADGTPKTWAELARDHSQDKATALRSGNLGFLTASGESTEPGLRVDATVVRAAQAVRDGDIVRAPVAEGAYFAGVWRRGTLPAQKHSVEDVAPQIREILRRERAKEEVDRLVAHLRSAKLRDLHEERLDELPLNELPLDPARDAR